MLAVVGVAAIALGTGFLNNNIELWIQEFGVGSGDIETPVEHITVDFRIVQQEVGTTGIFENVIDACLFTLDSAVGDPNSDVKDSELTCKLTGHDANWIANGLIIAEGTICADSFPTAGNPYLIPMGANECGTALGPTSVDVRDVGDVIVVAHADTYSGGDHNAGNICTDLLPAGQILVPATNECELSNAPCGVLEIYNPDTNRCIPIF